MFQQNISTDDSIYYNHFKKDPWEGGKGVSRFRLSLRAGSANGYVVTGRLLGILVLQFQMVKIRISLSNC